MRIICEGFAQSLAGSISLDSTFEKVISPRFFLRLDLK